MKELSFYFSLAVIFLSCTTDGSKMPNNSSVYACQRDSDCVLLQRNCCSCNASGTRQALNKQAAQARLEKLATECQDTMCAQMISTDPSCEATAKAICLDGKCVIDQ